MSNYNTQLQSNNTDLQTVLQTLQTKATGGEQATPEISVNSNGLITATAGTKSSTHQLAFQPAKTIIPTTATQIAVSSGYYTGGNITVAPVQTQTKSVTPTSTAQNVTPDSGKFLFNVTVNGDSDLVAGNIKSGVNIFGVTGTYVGSGGGDTSMEDSLVTRTLTSYTNDRVTSIGSYAFDTCMSLTTVSFPKVTTIGSCAFYSCWHITTVSFPVATTIGNSAFHACMSLTTVSFPKVATIGSCAFYSCYILKSLYLTGSSLCKLSNSNAFTSTPIACYFGGYPASASTYGSIYVPASLLTSYKNATNWTYFSSRFVGI